MGSGLHSQQESERFSRGQLVREEPPASCAVKVLEEHEIGDCTIFKVEDGFRVAKGDQIIGSFREGEIRESEGRALLKLDKGMLFEVTAQGHRQIFSREKANLHGYTCADGYLKCGTCRGGRQYFYFLRAEEPNPTLRAIFGANIERVYGIKAHEYLKRNRVVAYGKEMAYDLLKYGPFGHYVWRVTL